MVIRQEVRGEEEIPLAQKFFFPKDLNSSQVEEKEEEGKKIR